VRVKLGVLLVVFVLLTVLFNHLHLYAAGAGYEFVIWGSPSCPACQFAKKTLSITFPEYPLVFIDVDKTREVWSDFVYKMFKTVTAHIPVIIVLKDGQIKYVREGGGSPLAIKKEADSVEDGKVAVKPYSGEKYYTEPDNPSLQKLMRLIRERENYVKEVVNLTKEVAKRAAESDKEKNELKEFEDSGYAVNSKGEIIDLASVLEKEKIRRKTFKSALDSKQSKGKVSAGTSSSTSSVSETFPKTLNSPNKHNKQRPSFEDIFKIALACAIDAINPCSFTVLVIFLTFVTYNLSGNPLLPGFAFSLAAFLIYYLFGLGLIKVMETASYIKPILAVLALFFGVKEFITEETPITEESKKHISSLITKTSSVISAFFVGIAVGVLLLPCTSGPYFVALSYMSKYTPFWKHILLFAYNVFFVMPFVLITIAVWLGTRTIWFKKFREKNWRYLVKFTAMLLILIALWLLGEEISNYLLNRDF